ncbi:MAG: cell surface protein SprA, partial [Cytophagales bacterium]|nr:cell surface protein SprA [Cytophagales bacterium]
FNRARLAWYNIDNVFFQNGGTNKPANISTDDMKYHYVRLVSPQEIYQNRSVTAGIFSEQTFDLAYYPDERGPYNYNTDLMPDGRLKNPANNFGVISRGITNNTDFDDANIQYLEFWLMDPFIQGEFGKVLDGKYNTNNTTGGQMIFQLGSISEDVMKDGRMGFENGLPVSQDQKATQTDITAWGRVTRQTYNTNPTGFSNVAGARAVQDVGFDGLKSSNGNSEEANFFAKYLNEIGKVVTDPAALAEIQADPSNDDFKYYLGSDLDGDPTMKLLRRYKRFNGTENNSPENTGGANYNPSSYQTPDNEDINANNTLDQLEQYFQYKLILKPGLQEAQKYIVSKVNYNVPDANGKTYDNITWYQMRIPLRDSPEIINNINSFKAIRFVRTLLTGFSQPVVLRMAQFQFVGSQWRVLADSIDILDKGQFLGPPEPAQAYISSVNIEENGRGAGQGIPYVIPPRGLSRDRDNTSTLPRLNNEQSMRLCIDNLRERDARMAFKTVLNMNLINYSNIAMFVHAQGPDLHPDQKELTMLFRIGTDLTSNYYEVEIPLKVTPSGSSDPNIIWPEENDLNIAISDLSSAKIDRNTYPGGFSLYKVFSVVKNGRTINVKGNPDITSVQVIGIGVKNPPKAGDRSGKSVCIWADELRLTGYNDKIGTAALGRIDTKLADLGTLSASTRYIGIGYGSIEQKVSQRVTNETFQFSIASNLSLDKFTPVKWGLRLPMYVSYDLTKITPEYDPLNPDVKLQNSLATITDASKRAEYAKLVIDNTERRSINFTNVQKVRTGKAIPLPTDIENFNLSLSYSDQNRTSVTIAQYIQQNYRAGLGYNYSIPAKSIQPFKFVKSKYLKLIGEF